jgi:UDP-N-acetyl-D-mannosaminuronate dehydrogenase
LAEALLHAGVQVTVHDPLVKRFHFPLLPIEEALSGADAVILAVHHSQYKTLTPEFFKRSMKRPLVLDARNIFDAKTFAAAGVELVTLGVGDRA